MENKLIFDNIHKYIKIGPIAKQIIDTKEFKRLKNISQLGVCHHVFPCGNHSRFEHSIGVYHLAGKMLESIKKNNKDITVEIDNIECDLTDEIIEMVKIGGLCHDLGHGPFSHVFDDVVLKNIEHKNAKHEERSCVLLEKIVKRLKLKVNLQFIKDIIYSKDKNNLNLNFIYQIVSNDMNSVDVDKFDYITRDSYCLGIENGFDYSRLLEDIKIIDNKICYPKQTYMHMFNLFMTRYSLHKQIYNHKTVKSIEYMIYDIIELLEPVLNIKDSILNENLDDFCKFTDEYMFNYMDIVDHDNENIKKAYKIYERIIERDLYKFVGEFVTKNNVDLEFGNDPDVIISKVKIGYISGNKDNPLDNIYFYDKKNENKYFKLNKKDISMFIPENHQEYCIKVFYKNNNTSIFNEIKEKFNKLYKLY
jgi:HD superfamily phosphohydrolase